MYCDADAEPRSPRKRDRECEKARLEYLTKQYGHYTAHMNQVFNFYLVAAALIASAFVQSLSGAHPLAPVGSVSIATCGAILSIIFWLLHMRGFKIAGLLDDELARVECRFGIDFMRRREDSKMWPFTNTTLFTLIYVVFIAGFAFAAAQAPSWRGQAIEQPVTAQ